MLTSAMKDLIAAFPLGFVASVNPDGTPAVSPKGTFQIINDQTLAYGDIRSPGTRANLTTRPAVEVNFADPFRRKAVRVSGTAMLHPKGSDWYAEHHPRWQEAFGDLSRRIGRLVEIRVTAANEIWTPPYDDGATEEEMITLYRDRYAAMFP